jgi:PAS domain S-box-containing protein
MEPVSQETQSVAALAERVRELETELARAIEERRVIGDRLGAVIDAPVIVFAFDREGIFTMSEGRGLEVLGLAPGEVVGRSVFELYEDTPDVSDQCHRALAGEEFTTIGMVGEIVLETRFVPVRDTAGQVESVVGLTTDITERRRNEKRSPFLRITTSSPAPRTALG